LQNIISTLFLLKDFLDHEEFKKKLQDFHRPVGILYYVLKHPDNATQRAAHICTGDIY